MTDLFSFARVVCKPDCVQILAREDILMRKIRLAVSESPDSSTWKIIGLSVYGSIEVTWLVCVMTGVRESQLAPLSLLLCPALFFLYSHFLFLREKKPVLTWILSILLAASIPLGVFLDKDMPIQYWTAGIFVKWFLCVAGLAPLACCLLRMLFVLPEKVKPSDPSKWLIRKPVSYWLAIFGIILFCWLPVWLAYFPGFWNYDPWQVQQVMNHSYTTHHPLIHTLLLGACYVFGVNHGNANIGVVLYDWIQMAAMAAIFSYTVLYIREKTENRLLCGIATVFYSVFPVNSVLVISSTKDILFSGLVLFCTVLALQYKDIAETGNSRKKWILIISLVVSSILMMMFRNNAFYAFAGFLAVCIILFFRKKIRLQSLLIVAVCFILGISSNSLLKNALNAAEGSRHEALSVSSQQFARIFKTVSIDAETDEAIRYYIDTDNMSYNPHIADGVKDHLQNVETTEQLPSFFAESAHLFFEYTKVSVDSYLYLTEGLWYLGDYSNAEIYGSGLEGRQGYLLTDYKGGYGVVHVSKFPQLESFLEDAFSANDYQHWPLISLIYAPALYVWLFVIMFAMVRGRDRTVFDFHLFLLATVFLGPCCVIRYVYPFVLSVPLMAAVCVAERIGDKRVAEQEVRIGICQTQYCGNRL